MRLWFALAKKAPCVTSIDIHEERKQWQRRVQEAEQKRDEAIQEILRLQKEVIKWTCTSAGLSLPV